MCSSSHTGGFSRLELLVTLVLVGFFFAFLSVRPAPSPETQARSALKSSLIRFIEAQENLHEEGHTYAGDLKLLQEKAAYAPEPGIALQIRPAASGLVYGYRAHAQHRESGEQCRIEYGAEGPDGPFFDGLIHCEQP